MLSGKAKFIITFVSVLFLFFSGCESTNIFTVFKIWEKDLSKGTNNLNHYYQNIKNENFFPVLRFPNGFIYINSKGETLYTLNQENNNLQYSASNNYYLLYHEKSEKENKLAGKIISIFDNKGIPFKTKRPFMPGQKIQYPINSIITTAFPRISPNDNLIVLFETGGMNFSMVNKKGEEIIPNRTYGPLITCYNFSVNNDFFIIGYINGQIALFNNKGKELFTKRITSGKYNVIKSVFISDNGEFIGVVAGLYDEEIIIFDQKGKILWNAKTQNNQRHNVTAAFSTGNGNYVIVGIQNGALIYTNPDGNFINTIKFELNEKNFSLFNATGNKNGITALSFTTKENSYVFLLNRYGKVIKRWFFNDKYIYAKFSDSGERLMLQGDKNAIYFNIALEG